MKIVQVQLNGEKEWHPFDFDPKTPQLMVENLQKRFSAQARVVDMAQVILPDEVVKKLENLPNPEITHVSSEGILVRYVCKYEERESVYGQIISWGGECVQSEKTYPALTEWFEAMK